MSKEAENFFANRHHADEPIYLNNIIQHLTRKNIFQFVESKDHKGIELPNYNWS